MHSDFDSTVGTYFRRVEFDFFILKYCNWYKKKISHDLSANSSSIYYISLWSVNFPFSIYFIIMALYLNCSLTMPYMTLPSWEKLLPWCKRKERKRKAEVKENHTPLSWMKQHKTKVKSGCCLLCGQTVFELIDVEDYN